MSKKELKEDAPTNALGASSSTPGTGAIDTYDPILFQHKKIVRRIVGVWKGKKDDRGIRR
jgi:hypothetical protein